LAIFHSHPSLFPSRHLLSSLSSSPSRSSPSTVAAAGRRAPLHGAQALLPPADAQACSLPCSMGASSSPVPSLHGEQPPCRRATTSASKQPTPLASTDGRRPAQCPTPSPSQTASDVHLPAPGEQLQRGARLLPSHGALLPGCPGAPPPSLAAPKVDDQPPLPCSCRGRATAPPAGALCSSIVSAPKTNPWTPFPSRLPLPPTPQVQVAVQKPSTPAAQHHACCPSHPVELSFATSMAQGRTTAHPPKHQAAAATSMVPLFPSPS
jgi:hypothetical protein